MVLRATERMWGRVSEAAQAQHAGLRETKHRPWPPPEGPWLQGQTWHAFQARPGTLEHFLTERYCLYSEHGGRVRRAEIHHPPWPLQPAEAEIAENTMTAPLGLRLGPEPPLLHYARRQDVVIWPPRTR